MKIKPFKLERYFAQYEFSAKHLLSSSDSQALTQQYILSLADKETDQMWHNLTLDYTESAGHPLLRHEISKLYDHIFSDNILVSAPEEGIFLALNSILERGDHIICAFPGYQSLYEIASSLGCRVSLWQPEEENGWRFNPDFLNMPSARRPNYWSSISPTIRQDICPINVTINTSWKIAANRNLYVFSDEMYRLLEYREPERLPPPVTSMQKPFP